MTDETPRKPTKQELADQANEEYLRRLVREWPPLSRRQRERLTAALRSARPMPLM